MPDLRKHSTTSNLVRFLLNDSSTGAGKTGLTHNSAGLIIATVCDNESSSTAYTQAAGNIETISTLGTFATPTTSKCRFKEVDATNHPGLYEFQFANARFATASAQRMVITVSGASGLQAANYEIQLTQTNVYDAAAGGMTNLDATISSRGVALDAAGVRTALGMATNNLDTQLGTIVADTNELQTDWANGGRLDNILDARASQTSVDDVPTNAELATALAAADDAVLSAIDALPTASEITTAVLTTQMTESYRAAGAAPTLAQAQFELIAHPGNSAINGATKTLFKLDKTTPAKTFTLDSTDAPTAIEEAA